MLRELYTLALIVLIVMHPLHAAPYPHNDIDEGFGERDRDRGSVDYHAVMGTFKDFFMYLPVVMTTLKETMTGFPKFAEGIRILTSRNGSNDDDCHCSKGGNANGSSSNEIDNSSRYR